MNIAKMDKNILIEKYNIPTPRYTSYPTVPYWDNQPISEKTWANQVKATFDKTNEKNGISLYLHMPYCENICTFCGCNKKITKNHNVELPYINTLLKEWDLYRNILKETPNLKELHLGGGTPTFFSASNLKFLLENILSTVNIAQGSEFSIEAHPNVTTFEQLKTLFELGFRRISLGIQDFDPQVQGIINRIQPYKKVEEITEYARLIGYTSINFDLVYGLPLQKEESIIYTIQKVKQLMPERIAFYSYAHVPWKSPGQRRYTESDLPSALLKRRLYETGREMLEEVGYIEIGMDHFALPSDNLYQAMQNKELHRNFMGYTTGYTELLLGIGVSSISDTWNTYIQNNKVLENYMNVVNSGKLPISSGHILTEEDMVLRRHILNLICNFETEWDDHSALIPDFQRLKLLENDGLVSFLPEKIAVTDKGRTFIRNICMAFDNRYWSKKPESQVFSKAI